MSISWTATATARSTASLTAGISPAIVSTDRL
jgi:hypothetical protein